MKKFYIQTMGCQMNVADSDAMALELHRRGMLPTGNREEAEVIILNTCTVRDSVELNAFAYIGRLKPLKEKNPALKIIIAGCVAQRLGEKLKKKFPLIDLVVGARDVARFAGYLDTVFGYSETGQQTVHQLPAHSAVSAFVTIMRGCDNFCSYCIVPRVRGPEVSRSFDDIVTEVRALAQAGVKEVTLLGQNVNSYAAASPGVTMDFPDLLGAVSTVEEIRRIRFTTNHPKDLSDKLIATMAKTPKICKHLHLPLQTGSDRILTAMNRGYTATAYLALVDKLRSAMPDIALTTDIMVGFPGETEGDFGDTMRLLEKTEFNALFAYKYSPREGTASFAIEDDVPREKKEERLEMVLSLANRISRQKNAPLIDTVHEVLVEKKVGRLCTARTDANTKVYFHTDDATVTAGKFIAVKITECRITTLVGEAAAPAG